ncbi:MAG: tRNA lysidine(34) synthetase TilS [Wenzhouxiangellaceae bacterium]|nr:tRNA lysidine(34) synthetase TilS [Wenzhouxiangellaceae bacterium]
MNRRRRPGLDARTLAPGGRRNIVAFSGGPDSVCLLHQLASLEPPPDCLAIHVDHGLDAGSTERARRARELAERLAADCRIERLSPADLEHPGGREAAARHARYARLKALMGTGDHLLTGHHTDDQAETVLLRLLRGAGPRGLAGMQPLRPFGPGRLGRPLLGWARTDIADYLERHRLPFIDDPTNRDLSLDRNFLRHRVLPEIERRWPGYRASIVRAASWQHDAAAAIDDRAAADRAALSRPGSGPCEVTLDARRWLALDRQRALAVVRAWCESRDLQPPPIASLESFRAQCCKGAADRQPELAWGSARLHAWQGRLWLDAGPPPPRDWQIDWQIDWDDPGTLALPPGAPEPDRLEWTGARRAGFGRRWLVGSPAPGDRLRPGPARPHRRVPELLREAGVPPWRRGGVPCIRIDGVLRTVGTGWVDAELADWMRANDCRLTWHGPGPALLPFPQSIPE